MPTASLFSLRKLVALACLAAVAVAVSACGGSSGSSSSETEPATNPPATTGGGGASLAAGKTVFEGSCGSCHTLADAGTNGGVGPNLDDLKPSEATVKRQVENGGGGMPAFSSQLSATQISAVAKYVASVAGKGGGASQPTGGTP